MEHIGFDPASMNYVATALQQPGGGGNGMDAFTEMLMQPPMIVEDHQSIYGYAGYASSGM